MKSQLLYLLLIFLGKVQSQNDEEIEILSLEECEIDNPRASDTVTCSTLLEENDGVKTFSGNVSLKTDLDASFKYNATYYYHDDPRRYVRLQGALCEDIHLLLPELWKNIAKLIGIPPECPISAGNYAIEQFRISFEKSKFPFMITDRGLLRIIVYRNDLPLICWDFLLQPSAI